MSEITAWVPKPSARALTSRIRTDARQRSKLSCPEPIITRVMWTTRAHLPLDIWTRDRNKTWSVSIGLVLILIRATYEKRKSAVGFHERYASYEYTLFSSRSQAYQFFFAPFSVRCLSRATKFYVFFNDVYFAAWQKKKKNPTKAVQWNRPRQNHWSDWPRNSAREITTLEACSTIFIKHPKDIGSQF